MTNIVLFVPFHSTNSCYTLLSTFDVRTTKVRVLKFTQTLWGEWPSGLYPCGKPCSRGTHNEAVKKPALSPAIRS